MPTALILTTPKSDYVAEPDPDAPTRAPSRYGYHAEPIEKGRYGDISKVREELHEALDADAQANRLMVLMEFSDMIGAMEGYLQREYKGTMTILDLLTMSRATARAFDVGERK